VLTEVNSLRRSSFDQAGISDLSSTQADVLRFDVARATDKHPEQYHVVFLARHQIHCCVDLCAATLALGTHTLTGSKEYAATSSRGAENLTPQFMRI
jgi:hypothetical protein